MLMMCSTRMLMARACSLYFLYIVSASSKLGSDARDFRVVLVFQFADVAVRRPLPCGIK